MRRAGGRRAPRRGARITEPAAAAIVVAAGRGERAGSGPEETPKQFRTLGGRPLVSWSLDVLDRAGCSPVIVVVPPGRMDEARALLGGVVLAPGGETRRESVASGLEEVAAETVVVHDAVRPFIDSGIVRAVLEALRTSDGAIAAVPVDETLKSARDGRVQATIDRSGLWHAQTPQAFRTAVLREAHDVPREEATHVTDDAQLVERRGGRVAIVPGSRTNIKLTYPEDFALAEILISSWTVR